MSEEDGMILETEEECDVCEKRKQTVLFDHDMSETNICQDCLIKIYREWRGWGVN